jgi:hypothetical protein
VEATKTTVIGEKIIGVPEKIGQSNACFTFSMAAVADLTEEPRDYNGRAGE